MELTEPYFLLAALLAVPVFFGARMANGRVRFSSVSLLPEHGRTLRSSLAWLPETMVALAVIALAIALAGPRTVGGETRVEREGIAIMMVVDTSSSMLALDLSPPQTEETRLDVVKAVFRDFVVGNEGAGLDGRPDDAIGLIRFARYADSAAPLTIDHDALLDVLEEVEIVERREEDGTAMGDALGLAVERLREVEAESRIVILLTDGVSNADELSPVEAARVAAGMDIKVYTIGAGTNGFARVRVQDPWSGRSVLRKTRVEIDEETLKEVAEITGGRYFRASNASDLVRVYGDIDEMNKTRIVEDKIVTYEEHFALPLLIGLGLACVGWLLGATVLRRLP